MPAYSVLAVTPTDDAWVPGYLGPVGDLVRKHGGKYIARTASHERLEGEGYDGALRIIIEWPNVEAGRAFMSDPDYAPFLKSRTEGSESHHVLIDGKDDLG